MLKRFEVRNFKSFKNNTIFDLEKTNYQMLSSTNAYGNLLKGAIFVGTNASGKSNAILAVKFLLDALLGMQSADFQSGLCLFSQNPTLKLRYVFEIDKVEIEYEIEYQRIDKLIKEKLLVDHSIILSREGSVATVSVSEKTEYTDVPSDSLFLRDIYFNTRFRGNEILQKWFDYLSKSIYCDLYTRTTISYRNIDLSLFKYLEQNGVDEINSFLNDYRFNQQVIYDNEAHGKTFKILSKEKSIFLKRNSIGDPIPLSLESLGNKILLTILPLFFECIKNGGMLILDEFSSGLHNELEELLIRYFMKKSTNSQILFASHSTNLLTNQLLRPDQIYSVDFDGEGSRIKRFSSERPREAQNLEKMYLSGVFNGVPNYASNVE